MLKEYKEKRLKPTTKTYMREAINYQMIIIKENDDFYVTIKKYDLVSEPFILTNKSGKQWKYIENGYYLIEFTPLKENYNIRFYLDEKKEVISYYADISLENGIKDKVPYYIDLYLDVITDIDTGGCYLDDEDELSLALEQKIITIKDYDFAYEVAKKLIKEIETGKNVFVNIDKKQYLDRYNL